MTKCDTELTWTKVSREEGYGLDRSRMEGLVALTELNKRRKEMVMKNKKESWWDVSHHDGKIFVVNQLKNGNKQRLILGVDDANALVIGLVHVIKIIRKQREEEKKANEPKPGKLKGISAHVHDNS